MKKVLAQLFLISFLAVLVAPVVVFAYPTCPTCSVPTEACNCSPAGTETTYPSGAQIWCYNGTAYTSLSTCTTASGGGTGGSGSSITTIPGLLAKLTQISDWIFQGLLIIAGIFLVVAGYFFVTGGGEPEKVNKARQMLINALIGVAIAVAAKGLVALVQSMVR